MVKFRIFFVIFFFFFLFFLFNCSKINYFSSYRDEAFFDSFRFTFVSNNYFGYLEIPKINFNKGFYSYSSLYNDVDKGIELINDFSSLKEGVVLASHSGNSRVSYFKNLYKVSVGDYVYLSFDSKKYTYRVTNKYEVLKNGYLDIPSDSYLLVLTTCSYNSGKQLVVCCTLL